MPVSVGPTLRKTVGNSGDLNALNATVQTVDTQPGELWSWNLDNPGAKAYLRIYNLAAGSVTIASQQPFQQIQLFANQVNLAPQGFIPQNCSNDAGWSIAATAEAFDGTNATNPSGTITGVLQYKHFGRGIAAS